MAHAGDGDGGAVVPEDGVSLAFSESIGTDQQDDPLDSPLMPAAAPVIQVEVSAASVSGSVGGGFADPNEEASQTTLGGSFRQTPVRSVVGRPAAKAPEPKPVSLATLALTDSLLLPERASLHFASDTMMLAHHRDPSLPLVPRVAFRPTLRHSASAAAVTSASDRPVLKARSLPLRLGRRTPSKNSGVLMHVPGISSTAVGQRRRAASSGGRPKHRPRDNEPQHRLLGGGLPAATGKAPAAGPAVARLLARAATADPNTHAHVRRRRDPGDQRRFVPLFA